MARAKKKTTRKKTAGLARKSRARIARKAARKSTAKKAKKAATKKSAGRRKSTASGRNADVERRWQEYWKCRKELEDSIAAVKQAEEDLSAARSQERTHRQAFEQTKNALKDLLEVEPASGSSHKLTLMDRDPGASGGGAPPSRQPGS